MIIFEGQRCVFAYKGGYADRSGVTFSSGLQY